MRELRVVSRLGVKRGPYALEVTVEARLSEAEVAWVRSGFVGFGPFTESDGTYTFREHVRDLLVVREAVEKLEDMVGKSYPDGAERRDALADFLGSLNVLRVNWS